MTALSEARARTRAARRLYRLPDAEERAAEARARLEAALLAADADAVTVPGFRIARTPDGIAVTAVAPVDVDQLALWSPAQ